MGGGLKHRYCKQNILVASSLQLCVCVYSEFSRPLSDKATARVRFDTIVQWFCYLQNVSEKSARTVRDSF
jgi:hypothetical protein